MKQDPDDPHISFSTNMLFSGAQVLRDSGIIKDGVGESHLLVLASKVFLAMKRSEGPTFRLGTPQT